MLDEQGVSLVHGERQVTRAQLYEALARSSSRDGQWRVHPGADDHVHVVGQVTQRVVDGRQRVVVGHGVEVVEHEDHGVLVGVPAWSTARPPRTRPSFPGPRAASAPDEQAPALPARPRWARRSTSAPDRRLRSRGSPTPLPHPAWRTRSGSSSTCRTPRAPPTARAGNPRPSRSACVIAVRSITSRRRLVARTLLRQWRRNVPAALAGTPTNPSVSHRPNRSQCAQDRARDLRPIRAVTLL